MQNLPSFFDEFCSIEQKPLDFPKDSHFAHLQNGTKPNQPLELIEETFGADLKTRVVAKYPSDTDFQTLITACGANLYLSDVEKLFNAIKSNDTTMACKNYEVEKFNEIRTVEKFKELTSEQLMLLVDTFRTLPTSDGKKNLYDDLPMSKTQPLRNDLKILSLCDSWKELAIEEEYQVALSEFTGKILAYRDLEKGMVIPLPDKEGRPILYRVQSTFNKEGFVPTILVPVNPKESKEVHLIFRGTKTLEQWTKRNSDYNGIGRTIFEKYQEELLANLNVALTDEETILNIGGHSLGGADAQRALVTILENSNSRIKTINMISHNSPRPEPELNLRLKKAILTTEIMVNLTHVRFFDKSYEDGAQKAGNIFLGADHDGQWVGEDKELFKNSSKITRRLLDITIKENPGYIQGALQRHTYRAFLTKGRNWEWRKDPKKNDEEQRLRMEDIFARYHYQSPDGGLLNVVYQFGQLGSPFRNGLALLTHGVAQVAAPWLTQ